MSNLKKIQKEAWQYYKSWMKEKTFCKALNKEVKVTMSGWDHITQGGKHRRKVKDKINKLNLMKQAKFIIKNSQKIRTESKSGQQYIILEDKSLKSYTIRVILKENHRGEIEFHSVMRH